jgi:phage gpG-like protein
MSARIEWAGDEVKKKVHSAAVQFLTLACLLIVRRAKELLSTPGTGKVKGKQTGPVVHSAPGDSPFKQTGRLRASVTYEVDEKALEARVGTNVDYGMYLELGTKKGIRPRPWLRRALDEVKAQIQSLAATLGVHFQ